jgi:hypothetical protein
MVSFSFISLATISLAAAAYASSDFTIRQIGAPNTLEYEVYFGKYTNHLYIY